MAESSYKQPHKPPAMNESRFGACLGGYILPKLTLLKIRLFCCCVSIKHYVLFRPKVMVEL